MRLEEILKLQDSLNKKFNFHQSEIGKLPLDEQLQVVRNYLEALVIEVGEALKSAKARWWKKDKDWNGVEDLQEEIVDCFHFLFSAWLATGGTAQQLFEQYCKKNEKNNTRQDWEVNENRD